MSSFFRLEPFSWAGRRAGSVLSLNRVALLLVLLAVSYVRWRGLDVSLDRDEGEYAYMGQLMLHGVPPYREAFNMKLPGTYAAYALIEAAFGQTIRGLRFGFLLVNLATIGFVFLLGRRLFDARRGLWAAATFALMSQSPDLLALAGQPTNFINLCVVPAWLVLLSALQKKSAARFFGCGVLLGLAFEMKQQALFFVPLALFYAFWKRRDDGAQAALRSAAWLGLGTALPYALTATTLWATGDWKSFSFWTIRYARIYAGLVPLSQAWIWFQTSFHTLLAGGGVWALAFVGTVVLWKKVRRHRVFLSGLLACSMASVVPGFYFRPHYFIPLLPVVSLLVSLVATQPWPRARWRWQQGMAPGAVALCLLLIFWSRHSFFLRASPFQMSRAIYGNNPFPEAVTMGRYLANATSPGDRIAVIGSEPQIYFYARRRSASSYIYAYPLMEHQPYARQMQNQMIAQIERANPEFIVFEGYPLAWLAWPDSDKHVFRWFHNYRRNYQVSVLIELWPQGSRWIWNPAPNYQPGTDDLLVVWRRRS